MQRPNATHCTVLLAGIAVLLAGRLASAADADRADPGARWLQPFVAQARESGWDLVAVDPASPTQYVDFARAADIRLHGGYLETSIREERSSPGSLELPGSTFLYLSTAGRWVVDCRGNRFTAISQTWYHGNALAGESHAESDPTLEHWNAIAPSTLGAIVHDWVCAHPPRP